jgi:histidyl-tRNA synthetase
LSKAKIQAIRGMNDVLPNQSPHWQYLEKHIRQLMAAYAYNEIRFPVLEQTQLFKRSIGDATDIVEKEMYTFEDRNGDSLSLRPEGTASCVRAAEQHGLLYNQIQKLWYMGPMYRHERPQKGRYRQFYQFGVEAFGMSASTIESEVILLSAALWKNIGLSEYLTLEVNNLGTPANRVAYSEALRTYLINLKDALDEDSQRRLDSNVLRILDSKNPETQALLENAPLLEDFIDTDSQAEFEKLLSILTDAGIRYKNNSRLVRGLDYYNGMVFEWTTQELGAQATVCAGGRYDGLVKQLGGGDTPAVGFAMGMERVLLMLEDLGKVPEAVGQGVDIFIALIGDQNQAKGLLLAENIRQAMPSLRVLTHCGGGKYNSQLKKAYASGAQCVLVLESDEIKLKMLDDEGQNEALDSQAVISRLEKIFT